MGLQRFSEVKHWQMMGAIEKEEKSGVIKKVKWGPEMFEMSAFPVPKTSGDVRLILDCRLINNLIQQRRFKMQNVSELPRVLTRFIFATKADLTLAFHAVTMQQKLKEYMNFTYDSLLHQYCGLPFGLRSSPRIFSTLLAACVRHISWRGIVTVF
jgi:hypothetical protein